MKCAEFRSMAESYVAGELPVDTNHEMITHLERCPGCRSEFDARVALRQTLRAAFERSETLAPTPRLVADVRATLMAQRAPTRSRFVSSTKLLAVAAGIVLIVIIGMQFRLLDRLQDGSVHLQTLAAQAAGDHRDCALEQKLAEPPISLEEAARRYNTVYAGLRQIVDDSQPVRTGEIEVIAAHWCLREGRFFAHVVVRRRGHIVSLLLTPVDRADVTQTDVGLCPPIGGFNIACFGVPRHAGFVVSDLSDIDNLNLAHALAPALRAYLERA